MPPRLLLALLLVGCGSEPTRRAEPAVREPARKPDGVVLTLAVRDLTASLEALGGLGGPFFPALRAPFDARAVALVWAGFDPSAKGSIDPHGNLFVVGIGNPVELAIGLPLLGGAPRHLEPSGQRAAVVDGSMLVVAQDPAVARAVGPYIGRMLAGENLDHSARLELEGAATHLVETEILQLVTELTVELRADARAFGSQMGREPDLGEPEAVVDWIDEVVGRAALNIGSGALVIELDVGARRIDVSAELRPRPGCMLVQRLLLASPGDPTLLGEMPADVTAALWLRRSERERTDESHRTLSILSRVAGERLGSSEAEVLARLLGYWDSTVSDQSAFALTRNGTRLGAILASEARGFAAAEALRGFAEMAGRGYFALVGERLGLWSGPPRRLPAYRLGDASVSAHAFRAPAGGPLGPSWEAHVAASPARARACAGDPGHVRACLSQSLSLPPHQSLSDVPVVRQLRERGRGRLTSLGVASPSALLRVLAALGGQRWQRLADQIAALRDEEFIAWSVGTENGRILIDLRLPPTELRALLELVPRLRE